MSQNSTTQPFGYKVLMRLAVGPAGYAAELSFRGAEKRVTGATGSSPEETASVGLAAALGALRSPCFVEVYLDGQFEALVRQANQAKSFQHRLQPYFITPADDPKMKALAAEVEVK